MCGFTRKAMNRCSLYRRQAIKQEKLKKIYPLPIGFLMIERHYLTVKFTQLKKTFQISKNYNTKTNTKHIENHNRIQM